MSSEARELQEDIEKYFKDTSDAIFILVVDRFVYHSESKMDSVNKLFEGFLKENGLFDSYKKYEFDISNKAGYFRKCNYSASGIIESLKQCFLSASHQRFRRATSKLLKNG